MTTKLLLEKILEGILQTGEKDKHFHKTIERNNHARVWNEE